MGAGRQDDWKEPLKRKSRRLKGLDSVAGSRHLVEEGPHIGLWVQCRHERGRSRRVIIEAGVDGRDRGRRPRLRGNSSGSDWELLLMEEKSRIRMQRQGRKKRQWSDYRLEGAESEIRSGDKPRLMLKRRRELSFDNTKKAYSKWIKDRRHRSKELKIGTVFTIVTVVVMALAIASYWCYHKRISTGGNQGVGGESPRHGRFWSSVQRRSMHRRSSGHKEDDKQFQARNERVHKRGGELRPGEAQAHGVAQRLVQEERGAVPCVRVHAQWQPGRYPLQPLKKGATELKSSKASHGDSSTCTKNRSRLWCTGDIKSSNIQDADMNARLGYFGLARLFEHGTNPHTTHVVGTGIYRAGVVAHREGDGQLRRVRLWRAAMACSPHTVQNMGTYIVL
ncbi:hypothetical protein B296_00022896 [Ensete ventricosum]|uniref:Uncharacterized protein n=1 Tax=Ensete ventricosum TaxID=4639 RepID=A0A427APP5_ENSVE|nr:hypothetical protein B296_00022896 [Ensete ventricosum]